MLNIIVDHAPTRADNAVVLEGLVRFNEKIMGEPRDKFFSVFLKDSLMCLIMRIWLIVTL